jgi:hypothetical protein
MKKINTRNGYCAAILVAAVLLFASCVNAANTEIKTADYGQARALGAAEKEVRQEEYTVPSISWPNLITVFSDIATNPGPDFVITLVDDTTSQSIPVTASAFAGKSITIMDKDEGYTVTLAGGGALFTVGSKVTLTVTGGVTLKGVDNNKSALVRVNEGGVFNLSGDAVITGNINIAGEGGGVVVYGGGLFNMSGNSQIHDNGTGSSAGSFAYGGGVYVTQEGAVFNLSEDAAIYANTCTTQGWKAGGGGVKIGYSAVFNMNGGTIRNNSVTGSLDAAVLYGGGVYISVHASTFNMTDGVIAGNVVSHSEANVSNLLAGGGGVCIDTDFWADGVTLNKTGGTIYGDDDPVNGNKVLGGNVQVYANGSMGQVVTTTPSPATVAAYRDTTVGPNDKLYAQYTQSGGWTLVGW